MTPVSKAIAMAKDPICGMDVDIEKAKAAGLTAEYQGKIYYFDSEDCKQRFTKDPQRYTVASASPVGHHGAHQHGGDQP